MFCLQGAKCYGILPLVLSNSPHPSMVTLSESLSTNSKRESDFMTRPWLKLQPASRWVFSPFFYVPSAGQVALYWPS
ncbi:MAG TPA: hypothetical protein DD706_06680 [Nitrospiraceae bacterium]|nr:hypothetical protein [Nitrospiraceae bacterium]